MAKLVDVLAQLSTAKGSLSVTKVCRELGEFEALAALSGAEVKREWAGDRSQVICSFALTIDGVRVEVICGRRPTVRDWNDASVES